MPMTAFSVSLPRNSWSATPCSPGEAGFGDCDGGGWIRSVAGGGLGVGVAGVAVGGVGIGIDVGVDVCVGGQRPLAHLVLQ